MVSLSLGIALIVSHSLRGATLIVDQSGGADFVDIQAALDAAQDRDYIIVKPGTYLIDHALNFNRLHIPDDPTSPPVKYLRLSSQGGPEVTTIKYSGTGLDSVVCSCNSEYSRLEGFTITGGTLAGVRTGNSSSTIVNCIVSRNPGGGLYYSFPGPVSIVGCTISNNSMAGISLSGGNLNISNSLISENEHGGIQGVDSLLLCTNCSISRNLGVGIFTGSSSVTIHDCLINQNLGPGIGSGDSSGLGIYHSTVSNNAGVGLDIFELPYIVDSCRIFGNSGGILLDYLSHGTLKNSVIFGNISDRGGGVQYIGGFGHQHSMMNCTISGNRATSGNGDIDCGIADVSIVNSIIWGNNPDPVCGQASNSLTGQDPLFVKNGSYDFGRLVDIDVNGVIVQLPDPIAEYPDFHLRPGSPAIDAGAPGGAPFMDLDGIPRPCFNQVDAGAYEHCPSVSLEVGEAVENGCRMEVPVFLDSSEDVQGVAFGLGHDTSLVKLLDIKPGAACAECPCASFLPTIACDGDTSTLEITFGPACRLVHGLQEIARFVYQVNAPGSASFLIAGCAGGSIKNSKVNTAGGPFLPALVGNTLQIPSPIPACPVRGEVNGDAAIDLGDAVAIIFFLFGGTEIGCPMAADANRDGAVDLSDVKYLLNYLFLGGPAPLQDLQVCR